MKQIIFGTKVDLFRWFHVVPHVSGSFMLKCLKEPSWFPFSDFEHAWRNKSFLEQKCIFRWFHVVPVVFGFFMLTCYIEPCWFIFSDFKPAWWDKSFLEQNRIFRRFQVVPSVFGSLMLTCYMEPSWFPFSDFKPSRWNKSFWNKIAFLDGSMWFPVFSAPLCLHVIWNLVGSYFQIFSPFGEINHFCSQKCIFRRFHVVHSIFGSFVSMLYGT